MSSTSWNAVTGNWNVLGNWSAGLPNSGVEAVFSGSNAYVVTVSDAEAASAIYGGDSAATLAITGGDLQTGGFTWDGAFTMSGGTLGVAGTDPSWSGLATQSGGLLEVSSANGYSALFYQGLTQTGGTLDISGGIAAALGSLSVLNGAITGRGVLETDANTVVTLGNDVSLSSHVSLAQSGTLVLAMGAAGQQDYSYAGYGFIAAPDSTLVSNGQILSLGPMSTGTFSADFAGGGTLAVQGLYDLGGLSITGTNGVLDVQGEAIQDAGYIYLGTAAADNETLQIEANAAYDIVAQTEIDVNLLSSVAILGTLADIAPPAAGTSILQVENLTLAGALIVNGVLELEGPYSASPKAMALLNGSVGGSGTLEIGSYVTATVGGTALDVANLQVSSGEFLLTAAQTYDGAVVHGIGTIDTNGFELTLGTASSGTLANVIDGGGTLLQAGNVELSGPSITGAGTELLVMGQAYAGTGYIYLGAAGVTTELSIGSTGTLNLGNGNGVFGTGTAGIYNAGLIEQTDGVPYSGPEFYETDFTNAGTVDIQLGQLELYSNTATLGGLIEGPGTLWLDGSTVIMQSGLALDTGALQWDGGSIILTANLAYGGELLAGDNTTINTEGHTFAVAAGALDGVVTGGGTVAVQGVIDGGGGGYDGSGLDLEGSGTTLLDQYIINEDAGELELGALAADSATLSIASAAQYIITDTAGIYSNSGTNATIINQGTFQDASIYPLGPANAVSVGTFDNLATINDSSGILEFETSLVNDGLINVGQDMLVSGDVTADAGDAGTFVIGAGATLAFTGAFITNPLPGSLVAASQTVSFAGSNAVLNIENPALFAGTIEGFAAGDIINVGVVPDSTGAASAFSYNNDVLTLLSIIEVSPNTFSTMAVGTLALPGINPADLQLFWNNANGGMDIELSNPSITDAPFFDGNVYSSTWIGPSGDNWNNAADWATQYSLAGAPTNPQIENAVPPQGYDIVLPASLALDYDAASTPSGEFTANQFFGTQGSTFDMSSGTLAANYGFYDAGVVTLSGGLLEQVSGNDGGAFIQTLTLGSAGEFKVDDGTFDLSGNGSSFYDTTNDIAGTLAGLGEIKLTGGTYSIAASADLAIATLAAAANAFILEGNQVFNGDELINTANFNLNGFNLVLSAAALLALTSGTVTGGGTITVAGTADLGGLITGEDTEILVTGTAQTGYSPVELGTLIATANLNTEIVVAQGGTFFNPSFIEPTGPWSGTLVNDGLIAQTSPVIPYDEVGAQEQLELFINSASGVLDIEGGNMVFYEGTAMLDGVIEGAGTFELSSEIASLAATADLAVANVVVTGTTLTLGGSNAYSGVFTFDYGDINTNGDTLALGGAEGSGSGTLLGVVSGGGQLQLGGSYFINGLSLTGTGTSLIDFNYVALGLGLQLGAVATDSTSATITADAVFNIVDTGGISGTGLLVNAGLLIDSATTNDSIELDTVVNTGTIDVVYSELEIEAYTTGTLGGDIIGAGTLDLDAPGTISFAPGVTLAVATLSLQGGAFALGGNTTYGGMFEDFSPTIATGGFGLDLTGGGTLAGYILGGGAVTVAGSMTAGTTELWAANTTVDVTGTLSVLGQFYAGSTNTTGPGAQIDIGTTGVFDIGEDGFLGGLNSDINLTIDNAGLLEKTGSTGTTTITATSFVNSGTIAAINGTIDITGALVNDGVIYEDGLGRLQIGGVLSGTGVIIIDPSSATISSAVAAGQQVSFAGGGGTLVLADAAQFAGDITGFAAGDVIDISTLSPASITGESFANGTLTLSEASGSITIGFADPASFPNGFVLGSDGGTGTDIAVPAICYLRGTRILTLTGEVPIEELRIGGQVVTRSGAARTIKWIGEQKFDPRFIRGNGEQMPVTIRAGALGQGLPLRDLRVSPGHSLLLGGIFVLAKALINGVTITQALPDGIVEYYNIELATHDCLLAEGTWAESYADGPGLRNRFHNASSFAALYPAYEPPAEVRLCAPRPQRGLAHEAALQPVAARAAGLPGRLHGYVELIGPGGMVEGWAWDDQQPDVPVLLEILAGAQVAGQALACNERGDLRAAGYGRGWSGFAFQLPAGQQTAGTAGIRVRRVTDGAQLDFTDDLRFLARTGTAA